MPATRRRLTVIAAAVGVMGLVAAPASAASVVSVSSRCATAVAEVDVTFGVADDATAYGTLRVAQGVGEGEFTDSPAMTVRVRDGYGRLVTTKRTSDGSLSLSFWRVVGGPNWTVEATLENTAAGACTTPRQKIAVV